MTGLAIDINTSTKRGNVAMYQIEAYSLAVSMIVKFLFEPEYFIPHFFHFKTLAFIGKYQLVYSVFLVGVDVDFCILLRFCVFN